jgi:ComF family protein
LFQLQSALACCRLARLAFSLSYGHSLGEKLVTDPRQEIKAFAAAVFEWPARLLFPPACAGCRRQVSQPGTLCGACWPKLKLLERPWCEVMGTPFSHDMGDGFLSADAIANPPPFRRARAAVSYSGVARQMVQGLKYSDRTDLAPWMARWMLRAGSELLPDTDVVVPVPLHWRRFFSRRFNQSAELARAVAALSGKAFEPSAVQRVKVTRQQVGLGQREREDNVRGAFRVPVEAEIRVSGRNVLLVDDVYTTGATVSAVTKALKKAGAGQVDVLTFARVIPGDFQPGEAATI